MFEDRKDWAQRRRNNLIMTGAAALLGLLLLIWRPDGDWVRPAGFGIVGGVSAGVMFHFTLFRVPRDLAPAQIVQIEQTTLRDARRVMLWSWVIGILWTAAWLLAGVDTGLGMSLGGIAFLISLPLCLLAQPAFWRDLRRDGMGVWHGRLNDEATRAFRARADVAAMRTGLSLALILSALSLWGIWPLAGHEVGLLTAGAMVLAQFTRRWQLERRAEGKAGGDD